MSISIERFDKEGITPIRNTNGGIATEVLMLLYNSGKPQAYDINEVANATGQHDLDILKKNLYTLRDDTKKGNGTIKRQTVNGVLHYKLTEKGLSLMSGGN